MVIGLLEPIRHLRMRQPLQMLIDVSVGTGLTSSLCTLNKEVVCHLRCERSRVKCAIGECRHVMTKQGMESDRIKHQTQEVSVVLRGLPGGRGFEPVNPAFIERGIFLRLGGFP